jgi:hypothetical protein
MTSPLSAASKRALNHDKGPEWYCELRSHDLIGDLAERRAGMVRREGHV